MQCRQDLESDSPGHPSSGVCLLAAAPGNCPISGSQSFPLGWSEK